MKILVTGAAGYLGSVLCKLLLDQCHEVTAMDNFSHGVPSLGPLAFYHDFKIIKADVTIPFGLRGFDLIIPLAAIVGQPACDANPTLAHSVNFSAIKWLCDSAPHDTKIIFPCTNSGYGVAGSVECDETSPLNPISQYGITKVMAEDCVVQRGNSVSLRFATLFGWSPRMRRDLMVNDFVWRAFKDHALVLFEGGFRRNFVHVRDAARAFLHVIDQWERCRDNIFNVGDSRANMTKLELCERIAEQVPRFRYLAADHARDPDQRDYVVSNAKIEATGWSPSITIDRGIGELLSGYQMLRKEEMGNA